jgi:hypothetical protein
MPRGHEIGNHGWTHRLPTALGREGEEEELVRGNEFDRPPDRPGAARLPLAGLGPVARIPSSLPLKHGFIV